MRKMTLSGSRAMVNRKSATAGPKAMKVQPKNTAAVMLPLFWGFRGRSACLGPLNEWCPERGVLISQTEPCCRWSSCRGTGAITGCDVTRPHVTSYLIQKTLLQKKITANKQ